MSALKRASPSACHHQGMWSPLVVWLAGCTTQPAFNDQLPYSLTGKKGVKPCVGATKDEGSSNLSSLALTTSYFESALHMGASGVCRDLGKLYTAFGAPTNLLFSS